MRYFPSILFPPCRRSQVPLVLAHVPWPLRCAPCRLASSRARQLMRVARAAPRASSSGAACLFFLAFCFRSHAPRCAGLDELSRILLSVSDLHLGSQPPRHHLRPHFARNHCDGGVQLSRGQLCHAGQAHPHLGARGRPQAFLFRQIGAVRTPRPRPPVATHLPSRCSYVFHYTVKEGVTYMCFATKDHKTSVCFAFLDEISKRFKATYEQSQIENAVAYSPQFGGARAQLAC